MTRLRPTTFTPSKTHIPPPTSQPPPLSSIYTRLGRNESQVTTTLEFSLEFWFIEKQTVESLQFHQRRQGTRSATTGSCCPSSFCDLSVCSFCLWVTCLDHRSCLSSSPGFRFKPCSSYWIRTNCFDVYCMSHSFRVVIRILGLTPETLWLLIFNRQVPSESPRQIIVWIVWSKSRVSSLLNVVFVDHASTRSKTTSTSLSGLFNI